MYAPKLYPSDYKYEPNLIKNLKTTALTTGKGIQFLQNQSTASMSQLRIAGTTQKMKEKK